MEPLLETCCIPAMNCAYLQEFVLLSRQLRLHPPLPWPPSSGGADDNRSDSTIPSTAEVQSIIRAVWPDDLENVHLTLFGGRRYQADVDNGICCVGLFQIYWTIHRVWLGSEGVSAANNCLMQKPTRGLRRTYERSLAKRGDGWLRGVLEIFGNRGAGL